MDKIKIDIKNFILTGNFGCLNVGMTREKIIELIGIPDWYGLGNDLSYITSDMWTYGNIELYFNYNNPGTDKLGMLFIKNLNKIDGGEIFEFDFWIFKQEENVEVEFEEFLLKLADKNYKIVYEYEDQKSILLNSGVTVGFNINDDRQDKKFYASVIYLHYHNQMNSKINYFL